MAQQRSGGKTLVLAPQDGGLRPARANKLPPHPASGRALWLVMNSLPFGTAGDVKAPDPAVLSSLIFPIATVELLVLGAGALLRSWRPARH